MRGVAGQTIFDVKIINRKIRNDLPKRVKDSYVKVIFPIVCS